MYVCVCVCVYVCMYVSVTVYFVVKCTIGGKESVRDLAANSNFMATISTGGRAALKLRNSLKLVSLQFGI